MPYVMNLPFATASAKTIPTAPALRDTGSPTRSAAEEHQSDAVVTGEPEQAGGVRRSCELNARGCSGVGVVALTDDDLVGHVVVIEVVTEATGDDHHVQLSGPDHLEQALRVLG